MTPRVVVVYPCAEHGYEVIVSDCVEPGIVVHETRSLSEANRVARALGWSHRVRVLPLEQAS